MTPPLAPQPDTAATTGRASAEKLADDWRRRLVAEYRAMGDDELRAELESLAAQRVVLSDEYAASEAADAMWRIREAVATSVWKGRQAPRSVSATGDTTDVRVNWPELARQIKERHAGLLDLLDGNMTALRRVGRGRRGAEYAGPCPACGGEDRFIVWPEPPHAGFWCRRCHVAGSVIDAWSLVNGGASFFSACRALASDLGLALPIASDTGRQATNPLSKRSSAKASGVKYDIVNGEVVFK